MNKRLWRRDRRTKIELRIEEILKKNNIPFKTNLPILSITIPDFYLPQINAAIYCDGFYWHNLPRNKARDIKQNKILKQNNINVIRLPESEIKLNAEKALMKELSIYGENIYHKK
jgi:G:T-mismatch repair DNA endonuclease (very short patch repair protein)